MSPPPDEAAQPSVAQTKQHQPLCAAMLPPGLNDPQVWRLRFIVTSTLAPGKTMADHAALLTEHHAFLADLNQRGLLQFMGPFLTPSGHDCGDGMFCLSASSQAEAEALASGSPFHQKGVRTFTVRPWLERELGSGCTLGMPK